MASRPTAGSPPRRTLSAAPAMPGLYTPRVSAASSAAAGTYGASPAASRTLDRRSTLGLQVPSSPALGASRRTQLLGGAGFGASLGSPVAGLTVRSPGMAGLHSQLQHVSRRRGRGCGSDSGSDWEEG